MLFSSLRTIRELEKETVPWIRSMQDRDIVLAIGAAQEDKRYLTFKQLALLGLGARATVRRRLTRLIKLGYIQKRMVLEDGRLTAYAISPRWMSRFEKLHNGLKRIAMDLVSRESAVKKANQALLGGVINCDDVAKMLRERLRPFGTVESFRVACSQGSPMPLLTMVEINGDAQAAALDIGGFVFGRDLVCATWEAPKTFQCKCDLKEAVCLGVSPRIR